MTNDLLPSGAANKQLDPDTKFKVLNRGSLLAPACCSSCGNGDSERYYVDFGLFIDYFGQVYFCNICISDAAENIGLLNDTEIEFLKNQVKTSADELAELNNRYEAEHAELEHFRSLFDGNGGRVVNSAGIISVTESEGSSESVVEVGEEQSDSSESVTDEGHSESLRDERSNRSSSSGFEL